MGNKKTVEKTGKIEEMVPVELYDSCFGIRSGLNLLETILGMHFPNENDATALAHLELQEALSNYVHTLSREITERRIRDSGVISLDKLFFPQSVPGFIKYLERFGKVTLVH